MGRPVNITIIEDNPADVYLFQEALAFNEIDAALTHFPDGADAVEALEADQTGWQPPPDIVFIDLNMPRVSGFDVLKKLRETPRMAGVHAVIFTSSQAVEDRERANELRADRFIRKPSDLRGFFSIVDSTVRDLRVH